MNVKQFLCAGMTGALLVAGLTACAPGAPEVDPSDVAYQTAGVTRDTVLFTVDGTEVTADEYLFWLLQSVASAKQSGYLADDDAWEEELNGVPTAEYLKEDARNTSVLYTTVSNHAAAAGLTVTEEEQAEADAELETLTQRVDSYYGMTLQEYLDQQCISEAAFRKLNQVPYLARSLQTQMEEAGELTAQDADLDAMVEEAGYYKAKHILLKTVDTDKPITDEDGNPTGEYEALDDAVVAEKKALAEDLLSQLQAAEDKEALFDAIDTVEVCLPVFAAMVNTLSVRRHNMERAAAGGFINATDCADYLVKKGMPFREAYMIVGRLVNLCIKNHETLDTLTLRDFRAISELFDEGVYEAMALKNCVNGRKVYGGPSKVAVMEQIEQIEAFVAERKG